MPIKFNLIQRATFLNHDKNRLDLLLLWSCEIEKHDRLCLSASTAHDGDDDIMLGVWGREKWYEEKWMHNWFISN